MSDTRIPNPRSREYVKFVTGDQLTDARQAELTENAYRYAVRRTWVGHLVLLVAFLFTLALDAGGVIAELIGLPASQKWVTVVGIIAFYVVMDVVAARRQGRMIRRYIAGHLRFEGIRPLVCLGCHYSLTGSVSDHCPECGARLAPANDDA